MIQINNKKEIMINKEKQLSWLRICQVAAQEFSTCSKKQYFCVILGNNGRVLGSGYNGGPAGYRHCKDGHCPRAVDGSNDIDYSSCISLHAECNALLYSYGPKDTLIVNGAPCFGCAKMIAGAGIKNLVYLEEGPKVLAERNLSSSRQFLIDNHISIYSYSLDEL